MFIPPKALHWVHGAPRLLPPFKAPDPRAHLSSALSSSPPGSKASPWPCSSPSFHVLFPPKIDGLIANCEDCEEKNQSQNPRIVPCLPRLHSEENETRSSRAERSWRPSRRARCPSSRGDGRLAHHRGGRESRVLCRALVGGEELEKRTAATAVKHSLVLFFLVGFQETGGSGVD